MLTRFAPAPTGFLHLGHVANAIFVWSAARRMNGRVLLRIEDHDRQRSRAVYEAALLDDLEWLGFTPDVYGPEAFRAGRCEGRQSDRAPIYQDAAARLAARGLLYGCTCVRRDLADSASLLPGGESRYPGTCRDRGLPLEDGLVWRVRLDSNEESFDDLLSGPERQRPAEQCGDVAIRDRQGNWTYQFVASVDDWLQGIDVVVRGKDLLASTGRQIAIARLIGRTTAAAFGHHPLIMKSATQKLSKADGDTAVRDLRGAGWQAARVIGEAARRVGIDAPDALDADEAAALVTARWRLPQAPSAPVRPA
jgi:glutamyl-tRNA synthetase/glutamyl-Q tRNA(Asp) synthetase